MHLTLNLKKTVLGLNLSLTKRLPQSSSVTRHFEEHRYVSVHPHIGISANIESANEPIVMGIIALNQHRILKAILTIYAAPVTKFIGCFCVQNLRSIDTRIICVELISDIY